jgi:predicted peptidase
MKRLLPLLLIVAAFPAPTYCADPAAEPKPAPQEARRPRFEPEYEARTFKGTGESELKYGWLVPIQQKAGEKYPLVICLHGAGGNSRASGVLARAEMREKYPAFVLVAKCESSGVWAANDLLRKRRNRPERPTEKLPLVIEAVRSLIKTEAIDPARIYITGQSMGGVGSWAAIARAPELFAAAVPVCGAWNIEDVPKMVPVPVWAFHGELDATVPTRFSRELTAALNKAGGTVKYTEYPGVGHDSWIRAYEDTAMWDWLFAQKKTQPGE